jgi:phospholipid/cholesterol/gamma-HCH transport system substrate-binding protein
MKRAIKNHLGDFIAILALVILSLAVAGYVLHQERVRLPWESSPFTINAELSSAKAVTPGQGQTVRVSGVQVGEVGGVKLENGVAVVQMNIDSKYRGLIHKDATVLLRPKTGLDDMFLEVTPCQRASAKGCASDPSPVAPPGYTIPVANTNPPVDPDQILSALDADTRQYLVLLVNGAGQGLQGQGGSELGKVLERFLPTHQDLARLNSVVAERGAALRQLIHSLRVLNAALATKQTQIVQLVDSSSQVFHAFANANQNVSRAVADLPGTLNQATITLEKVRRFANILTPAAQNLIPAVSAIPAANRATIALAKPATPILKNQIRPFVKAATPLVRNLEPAAVNLSNATPHLSQVFNVLNHLFNDLAYHPGGGQHGYLWWLAWASHNARTVFATQDANGDFRQLFLQASCASLTQISNNVPGSAAVLPVVSALSSSGLCSPQATALNKAFARYQQNPHLVPEAPSVSALATGKAAKELFYPKLPTN